MPGFNVIYVLYVPGLRHHRPLSDRGLWRHVVSPPIYVLPEADEYATGPQSTLLQVMAWCHMCWSPMLPASVKFRPGSPAHVGAVPGGAVSSGVTAHHSYSESPVDSQGWPFEPYDLHSERVFESTSWSGLNVEPFSVMIYLHIFGVDFPPQTGGVATGTPSTATHNAFCLPWIDDGHFVQLSDVFFWHWRSSATHHRAH